MEDFSGFSDPAKSTGAILLDHCMWVLSRGLIIGLVVTMAYFLHVPFQRVMERDVFSEWEKSQKSELTRKIEVVDSITIAANKLSISFADTAREVNGYLRTLDSTSRGRAAAKLRITSAMGDDLRSAFSNRKALLPNDVEKNIVELLSICDQGVKMLNDMFETRARLSVESNETLILRYVADINEYKRLFISQGMQGALPALISEK